MANPQFEIRTPHLHISLKFARELIEDMKVARPECDACERVSVSQVQAAHAINCLLPTVQHYVDCGYEMQTARYCLLRRCQACAGHYLYPWAHRLDAERVRDHLHHHGVDGLMHLHALKALT